jgi:hypothetical protein
MTCAYWSYFVNPDRSNSLAGLRYQLHDCSYFTLHQVGLPVPHYSIKNPRLSLRLLQAFYSTIFLQVPVPLRASLIFFK